MQKTGQPIAPIGAYIADRTGDSGLPDRALAAQKTLEQTGAYRPLGRVMVEHCGLAASDLEAALSRQRRDAIRSVDLFRALPPETADRMAAASCQVVFPAGATVYSHSDRGDHYYIVISGSVKAHRIDHEGDEIIFSTCGPSEGFGEIALLTDEPRTATIDCMEKTCLLQIPKNIFLEAVFSNGDVSRAVAKLLAERILQRNLNIVEVTTSEHAFRQFLAGHVKQREPALVGDSTAMARLRTRIGELAKTDCPVLVAGEAGTELWDVAGLLHKEGPNRAELLLTMDARAVESGGEPSGAAPSDQLCREIAQISALFGRAENALPFAPEMRLGLLRMVGSGTIVIEHIECLALPVQKKLADYIRTGHFEPYGEQLQLNAAARIIATTNADLPALTAAEKFDRGLHDLLSDGALLVPPLRSRKRDIHAIVEHLLRTGENDKAVSGIDDYAYKALMAYDWPGNLEELMTVIRRAVSITRSERLMLEDIFIGPPPVSGKRALNLFKGEAIRNIFLNKAYPWAGQLLIAPFIAFIILFGLFGERTPDSNAVLVLTWGLWEPLLVIGTFVTARIWCAFCPLGALSSLLGRAAGFRLPVPQFFRNYGFYLAAAGLAAIFWSESAFRMLSSPPATALLVLTITAGAALVGLFYSRRAWCRYLCPLGGLVGVLSTCSVIEMRSNYGICNNDCRKHDCYTGNEKGEGCPMYEGPFSLTNNLNCTLCGRCIGLCPHHSPVLNLRFPGHDLWSVNSPDRAVVAIGFALLGSQLFRGFEKAGYWHALETGDYWWLTSLLILFGLAAACTLLLQNVGGRTFGSPERRNREGGGLLLYGLLPLAAAFEFAYHLERLLVVGGQLLPVLGRQTGLSLQLPGLAASLPTIKFFQVLILLAGTAGAFGTLARICRSHQVAGNRTVRRLLRCWPVTLFALVYLWLFVAA